MEKLTLTGWFGEQTVNGKKSFRGKCFFSEDITYDASFMSSKDSITLTIESMVFSFSAPLDKSSSFQKFENDKYELVLKKKSKNKMNYYAYVVTEK